MKEKLESIPEQTLIAVRRRPEGEILSEILNISRAEANNREHLAEQIANIQAIVEKMYVDQGPSFPGIRLSLGSLNRNALRFGSTSNRLPAKYESYRDFATSEIQQNEEPDGPAVGGSGKTESKKEK